MNGKGLVRDIGSVAKVSDRRCFRVLADWLTSHGKGVDTNIGSIVETYGRGLGNFQGVDHSYWQIQRKSQQGDDC